MKQLLLYNKMTNEFDEAAFIKEYQIIEKQSKKCVQVIQKLNEFYQFDHVILREALKKYEKKQSLDNQANEKQVRQFYQYLFLNQDSVEISYLQCKKDQENNEQAHYYANKNNISKFLSDEGQHFRDAYNTLAQPINQQQKGLRATNVPHFFQNLFTTKYTCVLYNGKNYFQGDSYKTFINENTKKFYLCSGDRQQNSYNHENYWIQFDDITDLLQFWARQNNKENVFVLYARSNAYLERQKQYLLQKGDAKDVEHPASSPMITKKQHEEVIQEQISPQVPQNTEKNTNLLDFLNKYKSKSNAYDKSALQPLYQIQKKKITKEEILNHRLQIIFNKICKKRAVIPRGATFDRIKSQSKTMNLQKFFFFCGQFQLNKIFSKQVLTQMFKLHALNLRTLDYDRFKALVHHMIKTDKSILEKLLNHQVNVNKSSINKPQQSKYKFQLKPVAGKDVNSIKQDLNALKIMKNSRFHQRTQNLLKSKLHIGQQSAKNAKNHNSFMTIPNKTNIYDIEDIRDDSFHPEKFFKLDNQQDKLWRIYESKIWKQDTQFEGMGGMDVLDKRIIKGERVLKKMTEKNLKYY